MLNEGAPVQQERRDTQGAGQGSRGAPDERRGGVIVKLEMSGEEQGNIVRDRVGGCGRGLG